MAQAAGIIREAGGPVVVLTHAKPDGDALGSVLALTAAIRLLGKTAHAVLVPPIALGLQSLDGGDLYTVFDQQQGLPGYMSPGPDGLFIVVDTGAWSQVGPLRPYVEPHLDRTLIVDHHLNGDIAAAHKFIDSTAAAAAEVVADLLDCLLPGDPLARQGKGSSKADEDLDPRLLDIINQSIFVGIASDTGWFKFSNVTPRTHRLAARLLERGVNHTDLYAKLEQSERVEKLQLLIRAVTSMKLLAGGRAATMTLRKVDFDETGALEEETERLIDIPQQVASIEVICLLVERCDATGNGNAPCHTRLSIRSKPGPGAVNVAEMAALFGGGGHARAAGAKVLAPVDEVASRVEAALVTAMSRG